MKKFFSLMLVAMVMLIAACEQNVEIDTPKSEGLSFYAEIAMTRADLEQGTDSKWTTVWEGNEILNVNGFEFENTVAEPSKFSCTADGVTELVGKTVTITMDSDSVPATGKGIMIETEIAEFDPTTTITLDAKNAFFRFTYTGDVTFNLSQDLFVVGGEAVDTLTITADGDTWVSLLPGENVTFSYTINGIKVKEATSLISAGKIYNLDSTIEDTLNLAFTGVSGTSYVEWSGKTATSAAVYAGKSAGGNNSIQLRSTGSDIGIVTTTSGGKVKKVVIDWNDNTSESRTLDIYGNNTAYTSATELYSTEENSNQGTKLGSISIDDTTKELEITGDYKYIGLRSNSNALYLNSITITWKSLMTPSLSVDKSAISFTAAGGEETFTVSKNFEAEVSVTSDNTLFKITSGEDGSYTVAAAANETTEKITGTITVTAGEFTKPITVTQAAQSTESTYTKITSATELTDGEYIIVYEDDSKAYVFNGKDAANGYSEGTISDNTITGTFDGEVTISAMDGGYSLKVAAGYMSGTSGSNKLNFNVSTAQLNTITFNEDGTAHIVSNTSVMRFNSASDNMRFRYFKESTYTGQKAVYLYKKN